MFFGVVCAIITGVCQPLNTLLFGTLTGNMIKEAGIIMEALNNSNNEIVKEHSDILIDYISDFAIYNSLIGLAMFVFTYVAIALFNFAALRQVLFQFGFKL